jgi:hypothetical protein
VVRLPEPTEWLLSVPVSKHPEHQDIIYPDFATSIDEDVIQGAGESSITRRHNPLLRATA